MCSIAKLLLLIAALAAYQTVYAEGALEIPQPDSSQSGISVVSGWHCDAKVIEVEFDGGQRMPVAYGTTRNDTQGPCGDTNNGFSLLWAYGLLGTGNHTVVAYADGVEFGRATFWVTDIANKDFLRGKRSAKRVYGFPELNYDLILRWQEANQNFVIDDVLPSMDSYEVSGMWEVSNQGIAVSVVLVYVFPYADDPTVGQVIVMEYSPEGSEVYAVIYAGAIAGDFAILETSPDLGANGEAEIEITFTGPRNGTVEVTSCVPSYACRVPVGGTLQLAKVFPEVVDDAQPSSLSENDGDGSSTIDQLVDEAAEKLKLRDDGLPDNQVVPRIR